MCRKIGGLYIKLIVAEKPSVAQTIAKVLGVTVRKDGYFSNDEYYISWCVGHLVSTAYPHTYNPKYKSWCIDDLPIIPKNWRYEVPKDKQKQFGILKSLMNSSDVESLICATDSGREGELIFRLVYHHAGCKKPFQRLWTSSLEDAAIMGGMQNLRDSQSFDGLYLAADCRDKADWIVGMNLSRLLSIIYKGKLAIGRVKTPTLAMIVERNRAITQFTPKSTYSTALDLGGFFVHSEKVEDKEETERLSVLCTNQMAIVKLVEAQKKTAMPPKLYDLTTLQRECNRLFQYTAKQTLDIAQCLYEQKLITYPRTDSQYLTEDMEDTTLTVISAILRLKLFAEEIKLQHTPNIAPLLDNSKVSDHYAIIPTVGIEKADLHALPIEQQHVLSLVAGKLLCAVSPPYVYESTKVMLECGGVEFYATGKTVVHSGFQKLENTIQKNSKEKKNKESSLPSLSQGQTLTVLSAAVAEHITTPPKPYTEDTLLSAMERAGNADSEKDIEKKGLGTPATRAGIIEGLVKDGYITRAKNIIVPTSTGINLVEVAPEFVRTPKLTADWESKLKAVETGQITADAFMMEIQEIVKELVKQYSIMKDTVDTSLFANEKEVLGTCPRCGGSVFFGDAHKNYYCENKACGFALWENNKLFASLGKKLSKTIVKDFLEKGQSPVKGFFSQKTGRFFDAVVVMKDTGKYINFDLKF